VIRPQESAQALHRLGVPLHSLIWLRAGFTDSKVAEREEALSAFIQRYLKPTDVVFTTWREDGHCDHEAVGRASAKAALAVGATLYELPVWTWHWATPRAPCPQTAADARSGGAQAARDSRLCQPVGG
jgi:LmbE family N-acetylglucosaminyl deacetylase